VRPESLRLDPPADAESLGVTAAGAAFEGNLTHLTFTTAAGSRLTMTVGRGGALPPGPGSAAVVGYAPDDGLVLPREGFGDA